jgi:hypothetical protein
MKHKVVELQRRLDDLKKKVDEYNAHMDKSDWDAFVNWRDKSVPRFLEEVNAITSESYASMKLNGHGSLYCRLPDKLSRYSAQHWSASISNWQSWLMSLETKGGVVEIPVGHPIWHSLDQMTTVLETESR